MGEFYVRATRENREVRWVGMYLDVDFATADAVDVVNVIQYVRLVMERQLQHMGRAWDLCYIENDSGVVLAMFDHDGSASKTYSENGVWKMIGKGKPVKHWHGVNGSFGCLPDNNVVATTKREAVGSLLETFFPAPRGMRRDLERNHIHMINEPAEMGAEYAQIYVCYDDCMEEN